MHAQDTLRELFFDDVRVPASKLLGPAEGKGYSQMMTDWVYERLTVGVTPSRCGARVWPHHELREGTNGVGKPLIEFQNTRFKLAECKTATQVGGCFSTTALNASMAGGLDDVTAAMAKYWLTDCNAASSTNACSCTAGMAT